MTPHSVGRCHEVTEGTAAVSGCRGTRRRGCKNVAVVKTENCHSERKRRISRKNLNCNQTQRFTQGDNSDGRLQIADDRYRVDGNRRPLQCHSERKRRISKKWIRFFVTQFLRMTGKKSCHSERSEESRNMHYELQLTILPSAYGRHPPLHKEGFSVILSVAKNLEDINCNQTQRFTQGDNLDGRLQIAGDRYRVVGNRRPLQLCSECY